MSAPVAATESSASQDVVPLNQRLFHTAVSALAIVALGWWSWYSNPGPSLSEVMANPARYEGHEIRIGEEPILESVEPDSFVVRSRGYHIRVAGTVSPDDVGRFIYVRGIFHPSAEAGRWDGEIHPAEHRVARGRHAKIWLSMIPALWVAALLLRHFRISKTQLSLVPRE